MSDKKFFPPIIFALMIILTFGWYQFFYEPIQREILNTRLETRRLREIEREISQLKERHESLSAFVEAKELELDAARNFLPPTLEQDKFIDELYRASNSGRVQIISVRAGEEISKEKFQEQLVEVSLEADYISLMNFIRQIIDGERLVSLEKFSAESAGDRIISCELSFKIFAATP